MPSGSDAIPWLGDYPYGSTADLTNQGVHMIGTTADMPAPSLGTQSGSDGVVTNGSSAFTAASGRFTANDTGATITIIDQNAATPTQYVFTVTYVSATALTLSGNWAGVSSGAQTDAWVLTGRGPSNAGLTYYASDGTDAPTGTLYESDGTDWVPVSGGAGGIQVTDGVMTVNPTTELLIGPQLTADDYPSGSVARIDDDDDDTPSGGVALETFFVDSTSTGVSAATTLAAGAQYVIQIQGTFSFWNAVLTSGSPNANAMFAQVDQWDDN